MCELNMLKYMKPGGKTCKAESDRRGSECKERKQVKVDVFTLTKDTFSETTEIMLLEPVQISLPSRTVKGLLLTP